MDHILPKIYSSGIFTLKGKLATLLDSQVNYTCVAIRKIDEMISKGELVEQDYYTPIGLDNNDYLSDLKFGACIITLKSQSGQLKHFPSTYLASFPSGAGVAYSVIGISIELGALPVKEDTSLIEDKLKRLVLSELGLDARTRVITLSDEELISQDTHERILAARESRKQSSDNLEKVNRALSQENHDLKTRVAQLEKWIVDYQEEVKSVPRRVNGIGFTP